DRRHRAGRKSEGFQAWIHCDKAQKALPFRAMRLACVLGSGKTAVNLGKSGAMKKQACAWRNCLEKPQALGRSIKVCTAAEVWVNVCGLAITRHTSTGGGNG